MNPSFEEAQLIYEGTLIQLNLTARGLTLLL